MFHHRCLRRQQSSLCYLHDAETGLVDVGDSVEDNAMPLEGLQRAVPYFGGIVPYFSVAPPLSERTE
jgi:hypothetical protein